MKISPPAWIAMLCALSSLPAAAAPDSVVTINEVHYHPADANAPEWVELHNQMSIRVNLGGWSLRGGVDFTFPENTILEPGARVVVSSAAGAPAGALGPFTGKLDNKGEEIRLHERFGRMMDEMTYEDVDPWPVSPDGGGPTLAKEIPNALSDEAGNWRPSAQAGGTPGTENFPAVTETSPRYAAYLGTAWKYVAGPAAPPAEWTQARGFDDTAWASGNAPLSNEAGAATVLTAEQQPVYLRKAFGFAGGIANPALLVIGTLKGDALVYLNGVAQGSFTATGDFAVTLPAGSVAEGANVLAVDLRPSAPGGPISVDLACTVIDGKTGVKPAPAPPGPGAVVINEFSYHARPRFADPFNAVTFAENPTEWVELHNRSAQTVDLSGWRLRGGADYDFPAGTTLAAGGFLVLDNTVLVGTLSNQSDTVRLRDAEGATVDEVRYFDSGRWPSEADGGGSTLERVDPAADGNIAESWAASDETAKSAWQTVSYRATGAESVGSNNPSNWREFLFGLLDSGDVLIDDVSVIEDPDSARVQVIQNGTFENDTIGGGAANWRLLGTHRLSHVTAVEGGKALRLIATAQMEHTYNCASTTLIGNRVISPSKTYAISYRARWLSGSPQLNSRLYLNRAARTTILAQPPVAGTPGTANSRRVPNAGPALTNLRHSPLVPAGNQAVRVSAAANDPDGMAGTRLFYAVNNGVWRSVPMGPDPAGTYFGIIPGQALNALVQFYVEAADGAGVSAQFPPGGPKSRALYRVGDGGISTQTVRNKLRLIMTTADANDLHDVLQSVSNFRRPCTVIYNDREVWYDAGVRLRSAPYGRQGVRAGWNISFGDDAPFRGVQKSVVIDGAFNMPKTDGSGWQENSLGASVNEMLFQAIANRAGDIPATHDDIVYFQAPRATEGNRRAQLKMTRFSNNYLEEMLPDGDQGSLYKQELIYYPTSTVDGNPASLKNAYNAVLDTEIRSFGPSKDSYRFNYLLENNTDRDDYASIMALGSAFGSSAANLPAATAAAMDVNNWMRVSALIALTGMADTYNNGLAHNIELYARPDNKKVMLFPWDQDHAFYYSSSNSIFGGATHRLKDVIQIPAYRRLYCAHLLDLCQTAFTNEYLDPVINHLNSVAAKDTYSATFRSWVTRRRAYVIAQVKAFYPAVAFDITTNAGAPVTVAAASAVIDGQGGIDVKEIRVSRNGGSTWTAEVQWLDARRWRIIVPAPPGENVFAFSAFDYGGAPLATDSITVTNSGAVAPADAANLVISEIDYHPAADGQEFVELTNISGGPIDLAGLKFTAGIRFDFPTAAPLLLAAGQRILVVQNRAAFEARHGAGLPIAGEFSALSELSNGGDRLTLLDLAGVVIADFSYGDGSSWPAEADGGGFTLTRILPGAVNPDEASEWRASRAAGGSPGTTDALSQDAFGGLLDYALTATPVPSLAAGSRVVTWSERLGADSAKVTPEVSSDLAAWRADPGDGSVLEILTSRIEGAARVITARLVDDASFLRLRADTR